MLHGRPLTETTSYTYDEHGRVATARTVREAEWLETDTWLALAFALHERSICPCGCGHPRTRAHDEDVGSWYEVEETVCHAGAALERYRTDNPRQPGSLLHVVDTMPAGRRVALPRPAPTP